MTYVPTPDELECLNNGKHLDIRTTPHNEICETPWAELHRTAHVNTIDMFCMHCDSGWLDAENDFDEIIYADETIEEYDARIVREYKEVLARAAEAVAEERKKHE